MFVRTSDPTKNKTPSPVWTSARRSVTFSYCNNIFQLICSQKRMMSLFFGTCHGLKTMCLRRCNQEVGVCVLLFPECSVFSRSKPIRRSAFQTQLSAISMCLESGGLLNGRVRWTQEVNIAGAFGKKGMLCKFMLIVNLAWWWICKSFLEINKVSIYITAHIYHISIYLMLVVSVEHEPEWNRIIEMWAPVI